MSDCDKLTNPKAIVSKSECLYVISSDCVSFYCSLQEVEAGR